MEIALRFILLFLGFLSAFRVLPNTINKLVNIQKHTIMQILKLEHKRGILGIHHTGTALESRKSRFKRTSA